MKRRHLPRSTRGTGQLGRLTGLLVGAFVVCVAVWVHASWDGRAQILRQAQTHGSTVAGLLAARVASTLQRVDDELARVALGLAAPPTVADDARPQAIGTEARLARHLAEHAELLRVVVFDADGLPVYRSDARLDDKAAPVERRLPTGWNERPGQGAAARGGATPRAAEPAAVIVARAWTSPDGQTLGSIQASVGLDFVQRMFESVEVGRRGLLALHHREDKRLLLSQPVAAGETAATLQGAADADGAARVHARHAVAGFPLEVTVSISPDDVLAGWRRSAWRHAALALLTLVALGGLLVGLHRAQGRRDRALGALARREQALRVAATAFETQEAIAVTDDRFVVLRVNRAYTRITGFYPHETVGAEVWRRYRSADHGLSVAAVAQALASDGYWAGEAHSRRKSGAPCVEWLTVSAVRSGNRVTHHVFCLADLSERKAAEERIHALAFYDPLTGLPNRRMLLERVQQAMKLGQRSRQHAALLLLDLDRFKHLNDARGHPMGDRVLRMMAERLRACVRASDMVARQGGDEFLVLIEGLDTDIDRASAHARDVGEKIRHALSEPCRIDAEQHHGTASLGVCVFRGQEMDADELLRRVDAAMYQAKHAGRNTLRFFDAAMQAAMEHRAALEADLREALPGGQFELHYQLQVDPDGRAVGAEALLRWRHPRRGMVPPADFIALAEETGAILAIGRWVLDAACLQLARWSVGADTRALRLAVNVSAQQFRQAGFVDDVVQALRRSGARAAQLELELTEGTVIHDVDDAIAKMKALRALGVSLAVDDFGTGHSSLAYLQRLPLDQLKIDRSFVRDLPADRHGVAIVRSIVTLCQSLGLRVIAEGVETTAQRDKLLELGCQAFQGYLFARPLPIEACSRLLRQPGLPAAGQVDVRPLHEMSA